MATKKRKPPRQSPSIRTIPTDVLLRTIEDALRAFGPNSSTARVFAREAARREAATRRRAAAGDVGTKQPG